MKQTAVQFLYDQIWKTPITEWGKLLHQAQQMEKEQIIEAYRKGVEEDVYVNPLKTRTQYFNETFKTKNHD